MSSPIRLIVGLGNPGKEYERTRHNVGFMVLDQLATRWKCPFSGQGKWKAEFARKNELYLLKPLTYMNLSGESVSACQHFYKLKPEEIVIIYDDVSLPLGRLRLRENGSAGGHNGMKSLIQHFGTDQFPRLRLGIGGQEKSSLSGHVLGRFGEEELDSLNKMLDRATEAVQFATLRGWALAMNQFNAEPKPPKPPKPRPTAPSPQDSPTVASDETSQNNSNSSSNKP